MGLDPSPPPLIGGHGRFVFPLIGDTFVGILILINVRGHWRSRLRLVVSLKLYVSFAKEPYERDDILQKRPTILIVGLINVRGHWRSRLFCFCSVLTFAIKQP